MWSRALPPNLTSEWKLHRKETKVKQEKKERKEDKNKRTRPLFFSPSNRGQAAGPIRRKNSSDDPNSCKARWLPEPVDICPYDKRVFGEDIYPIPGCFIIEPFFDLACFVIQKLLDNFFSFSIVGSSREGNFESGLNIDFC